MSNLINVGRITAVYGVKGWVKILSETQPQDNIFNYQPWLLKTRHGVKSFEVDSWRIHGKGFVAKFAGIDDRDQASALCRVTVSVDKSQLPELEGEDYYWHQLEGLRVISHYDGGEYDLGTVKRLLETGANDVLVVLGDDTSIDRRERLVPYVLEQFVTAIDIDKGTIEVNWDPAF